MFVPTPDEVIDRLRKLLYIPDGAVCIDPCCGEGEALQRLAPQGMRYGIELELDRARKAQGRMNHVIVGAMQEARVSNASFGMILLNPPYDASTEGRLEKVFMERCSRYLCVGGVLILIIKDTLYSNVANILRRHYDVVGHWRFPDPYYQGPELSFGQTVLVAKRRATPALDRDANTYWTETLHLDENSLFDGDPLPDEFPERVQVFIGKRPAIFMSGALGEMDVVELFRTSPLKRSMDMPSNIGCGSPPVTLKQGHIALTLASGVINGVYGRGPTLHLARGMVVRETTKETDIEYDLDGELIAVRKDTDTFVIRVRALRPDGEIVDMVGGPPPQTEENGS
jgi:hypothetical protein